MRTGAVANTIFAAGDYLSGGVIGALVAVAIHHAVPTGSDMVVAMLLGIVIGSVVHLAVALVFTPLLGPFHAMVPGSLIGMHGGMLFGMREVMQHDMGTAHVARVGVIFGLVVVALVQIYDYALRDQLPEVNSGSRVPGEVGTSQSRVRVDGVGGQPTLQ